MEIGYTSGTLGVTSKPTLYLKKTPKYHTDVFLSLSDRILLHFGNISGALVIVLKASLRWLPIVGPVRSPPPPPTPPFPSSDNPKIFP